MSDHYDVLIIGGGLVGATLACALEPLTNHQKLSVAVIEPCPFNETKQRPPSFDARSSALSYGTSLAYQKLGLWDALAKKVEPIKQVHVSDRGHFGTTRLDHEEENVPALGYVIDNFELGKVLLNRLTTYGKKQLTLHSPAEVTHLQPVSGGMKVTLRNGDTSEQVVQASLVILADGGRSGLVQQLGITQKKHNYNQSALITNIISDKPHNGVAYERFSESGPMALLPKPSLPNQPKTNVYGLVWTRPSNTIDEMMILDTQAFINKLQQAFGYRAGRFLDAGNRESYPLTMAMANEQVRPHLVLLGNSAHTMHPVAGQGYNLAIRDVIALAQTIANALTQNQPIGDLRQLTTYLNTQMADQKRVMTFCDTLVNVFSNTATPAILARNLGLLGLSLNTGLKKHFAKTAMGL